MNLPRAVIDRIHRYASQGSRLRTVYGRGDYRLLAETLWQVPIVILRASEPEGFAQMRTEALLEWLRTTRKLKGGKALSSA
jgi:hypothetical protein